MDAQKISGLIYRYLADEISAAENEELQNWLNNSAANKVFFEQISNEAILQKDMETHAPAFQQTLRTELYEMIREGIGLQHPLSLPGAREAASTPRPARIFSLQKNFYRYAAAIIIVLGLGAYLLLVNRKTDAPDVAVHAPVQKDILPGGNRATITLSDGTTITLDSAINGTLATQGNAAIVKLANGQIQYTGPQTAKAEIMNTMTTPVGGQYQLILPDGTKVWLNASSAITYPVAFSGKERKVSIMGEAYFEVATNKEKPFHVMVNGTDIKVLGTKFNVNAYADEPVLAATLLQGAVMVSNGQHAQILKPGQQAVIANNGDLSLNNADAEAVTAWKDGIFNFQNIGLKEAMRQLQRWYNIIVRYESDVRDIKFYGKLSKDLTLSETLAGLRKTGLHFRLEDERTLVVTK